jgi:hypothetical protein
MRNDLGTVRGQSRASTCRTLGRSWFSSPLRTSQSQRNLTNSADGHDVWAIEMTQEKYEQSVEGCEKERSVIAWKYAWRWYGDQVMNGMQRIPR